MKRHDTFGVLNPEVEGGDGDCFIQVIDLYLLLVEPINKILQRLSLSMPDSKNLGVRLWSIEHTYKLEDELLTELFKITN